METEGFTDDILMQRKTVEILVSEVRKLLALSIKSAPVKVRQLLLVELLDDFWRGCKT